MTSFKDKYTLYENECPGLGGMIPDEDLYTFAVLSRILGGVCSLTVTDQNSFIICLSNEKYPVWVWLKRDAGEDILGECYDVIKELFPFGKHRYNATYEVADYLIDRAKGEGVDLAISTNMLAYGCDEPIEPRVTDAKLALARSEEIELATDYITEFHIEANIDLTDRARYREKAESLISERHLFFMKNGRNEAVAMCSYSGIGRLATVSSVYTPKRFRRRGYAAQMVYLVTRLILESGKLASIYTDADYAASNACYTKIGYKLRGRLCTFK